MNKAIVLSLLILFVLKSNSYSQIVFRSLLSQDHNGQIIKSDGLDSINYTLNYISKEVHFTSKDEDAIKSISYDFKIESNGCEEKLILNVRDLIVTTYFEVLIPYGDSPFTVMGMYNKSQRWIKMKGVINEKVLLDSSMWRRKNNIKSFQEILDFFVSEIVRKIKFECL